MIYFFLLAIFAFGNELFSLVPDTIPTLDIGLVLIFGGLAAILLNRNANFRNCLNVFGFFSLAYMLLVAAHASIAAFYYQQPIIDGLIAARKQYYYLSFFLFAVLLSDRDRIRSTLDLLFTGPGTVLPGAGQLLCSPHPPPQVGRRPGRARRYHPWIYSRHADHRPGLHLAGLQARQT
ncbi:MAG: hypothetical protein IPJ33_00075 [Gammaproteobacteria bacterium]|nr:hypothetical protein [Gammaproteobacteria bacterium]